MQISDGQRFKSTRKVSGGITSPENLCVARSKKSVSRKTAKKFCTHFCRILVEKCFILCLILIGAYVLNTNLNSLAITCNTSKVIKLLLK